MKYFYSAVFSLVASIAFSQNIEQLKPIYGQLVSDSVSVKNVTIVNRTSKLETKTSTDGSFLIRANSKDTLYFNSPNIVPMQYVVDKVDFNVELHINIYPKSTMLDEIIIYRHNLTGTLGYDAKSLPTYYRDLDKEVKEKVTGLDLTSEEQNSRKLVTQLEQTMPGTIKPHPYDVNFVAIGKAIGKLFTKKPKASDHQLIQNKVYEIYGKSILAEELNMPESELDYYLDYLIAQQLLSKDKVESSDSLTILEVLIGNKISYYTYLEQEMN